MASKEDRRAQILAAAREEFAKGGYHATKIDDIDTPDEPGDTAE